MPKQLERRLPEGYEHLFGDEVKSIYIAYLNMTDHHQFVGIERIGARDNYVLSLDGFLKKQLKGDKVKMQDFLRQTIALMIEDLGGERPDHGVRRGVRLAIKEYFDDDDPFAQELLEGVFRL